MSDVRFSAVVARVNGPAINMPSVCPVCHSKLVIVDAFLVCENSRCSAKVVGTIRKFVTTLDIKNVGDATIEGLVRLGFVSCPADLYTLSLVQYVQVERKGEAHFQKMQAGLAARKLVSLEKFFGALNIPRVGEGSFLNLVLAGFNTFEKILDITVVQALKADRVGQEAAEALVSFLGENRSDILKLREHLTIQSRAGKKLEGKSFIITGSCSRPKHEIYAEIEAAGGMVAKSVNAGLSYLIAAEADSTSGKAKRARELGISIITEAQLMQMLGS